MQKIYFKLFPFRFEKVFYFYGNLPQMNNKHLLKTRLNSLAHYDRELERLDAARKETEKTKSEVLQSLKEFCPFSEGQILFNRKNTRVVMFSSVRQVWRSMNGKPYFSCLVFLPKGKFWENHTEEIEITVDAVDDWKIIFEPETVTND